MKGLAVASFLSVLLLCPRPSPAMEIAMFDDMAVEDQRDYLKFLVDAAQKTFIEQQRPDLATKIE